MSTTFCGMLLYAAADAMHPYVQEKKQPKAAAFFSNWEGWKESGMSMKDAEGKVHLQEEDVHTGHLMHMTEERWPPHIESEPHEGEGEMLRFREEDGENSRRL